MTPGLHADQPRVDAALVRDLVAAQHPRWVALPVERIASDGTTNAIYRLGAELSVRLPLVAYGQDAIDVERRDLPRLAPLLPLETPRQVAVGEPGAGYPFRWSVHTWIAGAPASDPDALRGDDDRVAAARALAAWIGALHRVDTAGGRDAAAHDLRGAPLAVRDAATRRGIAALAGEIDAAAAHAVWDEALAAVPWSRAPVWCHGDLLPGNLLVRERRLHAVIDFAGLGVGDPACDLTIAWGWFEGASRRAFRAALERSMGLDDATWTRARGHALYHAAIYIPYYRDTNPTGVAAVRRLLHAVLADRS